MGRFSYYLKSPEAVDIVKDDHVIPVDGLQYQQLGINHGHSTACMPSDAFCKHIYYSINNNQTYIWHYGHQLNYFARNSECN
jgi:hypothetical protein